MASHMMWKNSSGAILIRDKNNEISYWTLQIPQKKERNKCSQYVNMLFAIKCSWFSRSVGWDCRSSTSHARNNGITCTDAVPCARFNLGKKRGVYKTHWANMKKRLYNTVSVPPQKSSYSFTVDRRCPFFAATAALEEIAAEDPPAQKSSFV